MSTNTATHVCLTMESCHRLICIISGVLIDTMEEYCLELVLDIVNKAVNECIEIEIMFMKGHMSPLPVSSEDDNNDGHQTCETQCNLKSYLFDMINNIDRFGTRTERIAQYIHACEDLLSAVDEIQKRLETILYSS